MKKPLTKNQLEVIARIEKNGAPFIANSVKTDWENGQHAYIDARATKARKGIWRKFKQGDFEATGEKVY